MNISLAIGHEGDAGADKDESMRLALTALALAAGINIITGNEVRYFLSGALPA